MNNVTIQTEGLKNKLTSLSKKSDIEKTLYTDA